MTEQGMETFEVSPEQPPTRRKPVAETKCVHVTIVDHTPVVEGTDDVSYMDVKIPLAMIEAGLRIIPEGKLGKIDPALIVQMVELGATGELVNINEEKKSIRIRIE